MKIYEQRWFPFAFIIFGLIIHLLGIGEFSIYILDEAKNAAAAMEMKQQNEWILPTFNGLPRYDKPPLHYYFFMLGYELFGVNALGARFLPALSGWIIFMIVYFYSLKIFGRRAGFYAGLALLASIHWNIQFHLAVPDPFLILFIFLTVICYERFVFLEYQSENYLMASGLFLGLATLSKGPVAIVLVATAILIFMLLDRKPFKHHFRAILNYKAFLIFLIVTLPWYVFVAWKTEGVWLKEFIFHHNLNRFSTPMEGHGGGFYLPFLFVIIGFLPASTILYAGLKKAFLSRRLPIIISLAIIFSLTTLIFFMISGTKLPNYTAPTYPFLAIIVGWYFSSGILLRFKWPSYFSSLLLFLLCLGLFIGNQYLSLNEINAISPWFVISGLLGFLALRLAISKKWELSWIIGNIGYVSITIVLFIQTFPGIDHKNPVLSSESIWKDKHQVFYFQSVNPAFVFNMKKTIPSIENNIAKLKSGDLILTNKKSLSAFEELEINTSTVFEADDLFENTVTIILKVK